MEEQQRAMTSMIRCTEWAAPLAHDQRYCLNAAPAGAPCPATSPQVIGGILEQGRRDVAVARVRPRTELPCRTRAAARPLDPAATRRGRGGARDARVRRRGRLARRAERFDPCSAAARRGFTVDVPISLQRRRRRSGGAAAVGTITVTIVGSPRRVGPSTGTGSAGSARLRVDAAEASYLDQPSPDQARVPDRALGPGIQPDVRIQHERPVPRADAGRQGELVPDYYAVAGGRSRTRSR